MFGKATRSIEPEHKKASLANPFSNERGHANLSEMMAREMNIQEDS
jgi:hypothetical protein